MSEVLNPVMRQLQSTADDYVLANHGKEVYEHYQSLVKGTQKIYTDILSPEQDRARRGSLAASAEVRANGGLVIDHFDGPKASISSTLKSTGDEVAEKVAKTGGRSMARRTLGGILEAGETAAKVMRFRL